MEPGTGYLLGSLGALLVQAIIYGTYFLIEFLRNWKHRDKVCDFCGGVYQADFLRNKHVVNCYMRPDHVRPSSEKTAS